MFKNQKYMTIRIKMKGKLNFLKQFKTYRTPLKRLHFIYNLKNVLT